MYFNHAKDIFKLGRYADALPLFKNLHDLKYMKISAYLDAIERFLRTGSPQECLTLIKELCAELEDDMTSDELLHSGSLCTDAVDKTSALSFFLKACERFHSELN